MKKKVLKIVGIVILGLILTHIILVKIALSTPEAKADRENPHTHSKHWSKYLWK